MTTSLPKSMARYLKVFLVLISFLGFNQSWAQGPIPNYDYIGAHNGHHYYVSQNVYEGDNIAANVPAGAYVAAIHNQAENDRIRDLVTAYNISKYGGNGKAPAYNWQDRRNVWIGFTDKTQENRFVWSNGEPVCFINWNRDEPNNADNLEDYTEMLIMENYYPDFVTHGRWNDWFNTQTPLPILIEFGAKPTSCNIIPPDDRGNKGCSHGFWKNAKTRHWTNAGYQRTQKFSVVFGVTNGRGAITVGSTTLQQALETGGGGFKNLARQGVAALLNAGHGFYPYTEAEVNAAVRTMFNNQTAFLPNVTVGGHNYSGGTFTNAGTLATYLDNLNSNSKGGCPLNNGCGDDDDRNSGRNNPTNGNGDDDDDDDDDCDDDDDDDRNHRGSNQAAETSSDLVTLDKKFSIVGYPNPSASSFSIKIEGASSNKVTVHVADITGRMIEQRTNIQANQQIKIGGNYAPGLYLITVTQGDSKKQLKLVKQ